MYSYLLSYKVLEKEMDFKEIEKTLTILDNVWSHHKGCDDYMD